MRHWSGRRTKAETRPPWLLRGSPEQVVDYLGARAGLRLWAAFGNFRGGDLRTDIQENGTDPEP